MAFLGLHLEAHDLAGLKDFYVTRLELTYLEETDASLDVQVGRTKLGFEKVDRDVQPIYCFTIGIPEQRFAGVVKRLSSRLSLLAYQGKTVFDLPDRDSQVVYASDPAGNIVAFASQPATGEQYTWGISQVALPVNNLDAASNYLLEHLELSSHSRITAGDSVVLTGGDAFSFRFAKRGSVWFPSNRLAEIHHISATVPSNIYSRIKLRENPYYVYRAKI